MPAAPQALLRREGGGEESMPSAGCRSTFRATFRHRAGQIIAAFAAQGILLAFGLLSATYTAALSAPASDRPRPPIISYFWPHTQYVANDHERDGKERRNYRLQCRAQPVCAKRPGIQRSAMSTRASQRRQSSFVECGSAPVVHVVVRDCHRSHQLTGSNRCDHDAPPVRLPHSGQIPD